MDFGRLLQDIGGRMLRGFVRKGIGRGVDHAARQGKPPSEMTDAERQEARAGKDSVKRMREVQSIVRRLRR